MVDLTGFEIDAKMFKEVMRVCGGKHVCITEGVEIILGDRIAYHGSDISIYEFFFLCKDYLNMHNYEITSGKIIMSDDNGEPLLGYWTYAYVRDFDIAVGCKPPIAFSSRNEIESVFKACHYVYLKLSRL